MCILRDLEVDLWHMNCSVFASFLLILVCERKRVIKLSQNQLYHDSVLCVPLPLGILQSERRVKCLESSLLPSLSLFLFFPLVLTVVALLHWPCTELQRSKRGSYK